MSAPRCKVGEVEKLRGRWPAKRGLVCSAVMPEQLGDL